MKKRIVAVILSMVVCFSVVGCSKTEGENKSENGNVEVVSDDQVEDQTDDVVMNESTDPKADTTLSNGTIEISLYDDINDVFDKLGESDKEDEFGNIIYDDFTIQCFGEGDDKELSGIFTYSKNVTTSKGISVGSTYADVVEAYGEPSFESEEDGKKIANYTSSGYTLGFTIENDEVTAIAITAGMG
ncbi:hypothetical protein SAMN02745229_00571 [Butyrivibrio fibrisolvens DSM 3071]|uniref:Uncharacterized protein n=1 Tax=Butyrivibrio fibrisolvens DSM 3071 TaxID=1121131 RepID=A0A1M5TEK5_BUTFI|nr:hypothetical protein [Butyrivibrio fibrisolvens]SHH49111.1 hypothetical protein SAMN02745229_00571 [Butyrivibrio fibrisolvens DSM 3071]